MRVVARDVSVDGRYEPLVPPTSLIAEAGTVTYVAGYPGAGCTALGLALTGRITLSSGTVEAENLHAPLPASSALVDSPDVTAPGDELKVRELVAEDLALAGRQSGRKAVRLWLRDRNLEAIAADPIEIVPSATRTSILCALAVERRGVQLLVLDCPDRFGGNPHAWQQIATSYAEAGLAVVVLCDRRSIELLGVAAYAIGATDLPDQPDTPDLPDEPASSTDESPTD
ncbi:hypothetical protein CLV47_10784 [Antricoccus suffuscus]|uniref:ABC transporter family protein n=1 Tax=Antricoccus suffuscus TaxID=1629062 RepID=A0A2T1A0E2_9ACTN|nr:hypothetical protein [Antricoccus suffuscus]PRZ41957.1 hypothetical protein CLV47_10784 [Antricoccus suffuscus]